MRLEIERALTRNITIVPVLVGGAAMPLVTFEDFQKPASTQPTKKVYQLVQVQLQAAFTSLQRPQWLLLRRDRKSSLPAKKLLRKTFAA